MKKSKKLIIWILILLIAAVLGFAVIYSIIKDDSRLTAAETEWVNSNRSKVQNISVLNDTNVFGSKGTGVFYDFINDFSEKYNLQMNAITYNSNEVANGITLGISNQKKEHDVTLFEDHYVLISKTEDFVSNPDTYNNKKIGVLSDASTYIGENLSITPTLVSYESRVKLMEAFEKGEITLAIVPRVEYLDAILQKDYHIVYHFSDIHRYYNLTLDKNNETFSNVLKKYFNTWSKKDLSTSIHEQEFILFVNQLNISQTEVDRLQSVVYNYGFINNGPYEILTGGNFGGIIASYLQEFSLFSNVDFNFKRFNNYKKLVNAINDNKVDLYFGYQNFTTNGEDLISNINLEYNVLVPESDFLVVDSLKSLAGKTVYVENNTLLQSKLNALGLLNLAVYEGEKGLSEVVKNNGIIIMDCSVSANYLKTELKNYSVRYQNYFSTSYSFKSKNNDTFNKLFIKYFDYLNNKEMIYQGRNHFNVTVKNGTILGTIAKYFLYLLAIFLLVLYLIYRSSKRIRLVKKIKKEDRLKFIDQLTSLKNRNYLNDNITHWNKNTVYPQTLIVLDLNNIQEINDTLGYESGDEQIKAAANILIKTQLDNSDIMRTDGNEFIIYLVGYQTKQITSFIHKLNKEFKNLPYPYGACIGYSMILDDIKSIEDAINEAIEDVKKQKVSHKEGQSS